MRRFGLRLDKEHVDEEEGDDREEIDDAVLFAEDLLVGHGGKPEKIKGEAEAVDDPYGAFESRFHGENNTDRGAEKATANGRAG